MTPIKQNLYISVLVNYKRNSRSLALSLTLARAHTHTNTGIPVYVNEVCQVRNVLEMSGEIYKLCLFTSGTIHWTQQGVECLFYDLLKACQLHNTSATWNFTLSHTHTLEHDLLCQTDKKTFPKTHSRHFVYVACVSNPQGFWANRRNQKYTLPGAQLLIAGFSGTTCFLPLSSSFTHSFLPCIPPGAHLVLRTTDPPCFIQNNPCLFVLHEHALPQGCKERQK